MPRSEPTASLTGSLLESEPDEEGTSVVQTALNLANGLEGMGLLGLPFTVVLAGGLAFPIILAVALLTGYSACAIVAQLYSRSPAAVKHDVDGFQMPVLAAGSSSPAVLPEGSGAWERRRSSYKENGEAAFGVVGGRAVLAVQLLTLLAVAGLFLVLVGNALAGAIPGSASAWLGNRGWTAIVWLAIAPAAWIPSLRQISWLSGAGVALLGFLLLAVVYAAVTAPPEDGSEGGGLMESRQAELLPMSQGLHAAPCVFGMVLFSFSCHTMLPSMEAAMRPSERRMFPAVVGVTFAACTCLKALFMYAGWIAFGMATPPVVIVALEPVSLRVAATMAVTLNTALTLPMILFILQMVLNSALPPASTESDTDGDSDGGDGGVDRPAAGGFQDNGQVRRVGILLSILVLVLVVPGLTEIMAFAGSFASTTVVFIMPLVCHLRIRHKEMLSGDYGRDAYHRLVAGHGAVLLLGIVGGVLGFANALSKCA